MSAFQRRLDLLDCIPKYPRKTSTTQVLCSLENHGHTELNIRTVQRDLEFLERLGVFGLEVDKRSKPHGWSVNLNWKKLNISLMDANTALAFATLEEIATTLLPESTLSDLSAYFEKAQTIITNEKSTLISHWKNSVALINRPSPVILPQPDNTALALIKKAIFHKKQINADLKRYLLANKEPVWKTYHKIQPLGLIQQDYVITLVCTLGTFHQRVYKFPVAFMKNVEILDREVIAPASYNFNYFKDNNFQLQEHSEPVKLSLFARKDSYFVMSNARFSENQKIEETDKIEYVKISASVHDTPKLRAFLRGFGPAIEVLTPISLREYFQEITKQYQQLYR
ncbi:helix-turn-helix transcriptional regulator [Thalassotalea sp. PLHSN55]|uniref:helix-turn-helix transcriptional regulator n=1 Tax=Thalassotalea sp. PLHSN55 TaxID=3435888 RepID=UPI003F85080E